MNVGVSGFAPQPPTQAAPGVWDRLAPAFVDTRGIDRLPADDWPFLYLREAVVPSLNVRSTAVLGVVSLVILFLFSPERARRPNWRMFFLGAGFMLLETKSVVHLALLFGSTWIVNSVVFFAILVMVLASNLFVLVFAPRRLWPYYLLLFASLVLNIVVPMSRFLALPGVEKTVASCAVTFAPIFFAGVIFGTSFRDSAEPDFDFGSNIAGSMLGGFAESLSLILGFNHLLVVALGCYLLAAVLTRRSVRVPVPVPVGGA
jgi:hypothetical protein